MKTTSARAQLLCLRSFVDRDLAVRADHAWAALSRACHHHAYELSPTAAELAGWLETVDELERTVRRRLASPAASREVADVDA